jgi:hypothetical protein
MNFFGLQPLSDGFASQEHPSVAKADLFFAPSFATAEAVPFQSCSGRQLEIQMRLPCPQTPDP